jgi:hypothetical protein
MNAKSIKGKSPEEIQSALKQSMADGFQLQHLPLFSCRSARTGKPFVKFLMIKALPFLAPLQVENLSMRLQKKELL